MLFNSLSFLVFFAAFFFLYWAVSNKTLKLQNLLILAGSYIFYAWGDWRFLALIIGSSFLNYHLALLMVKTKSIRVKNIALYIGVIIGIGLLLYFKYTNFFINSFIDAFAKFGITLNIHTIGLILPLGISFYTFRILGYLIDVHKGKFAPTSDWVVFFSYVAFFPCLVAGPIDKAKMLIPQFEKEREFSYDRSVDALRQILWGLFKKVVIADNLATTTNNAYEHYLTLPGSTLLISAFYYAIQMYADFSGYSDMAIGIARLLGFDVTKNFDYPYFAQNIAEFWRKWHISLTAWLTEYIFTPVSISFRDYGNWGLIIAIIVTFLASGLWHGANWTFVAWGFLHGCFYIPLILSGKLNKKKKIKQGQVWPTMREFANMLLTFTMVTFSLIIFRADSLGQALVIIKHIFSRTLIASPGEMKLFMIPIILVFLLAEWLQRDAQYTLQIGFIKSRVIRMGLYYFILLSILIFGSTHSAQFIYLKF